MPEGVRETRQASDKGTPVTWRIDHVVIAVRNLKQGIERWRALGFEVAPGGRHTGRGTHNAIIRFGLDYLELISVYDEREAWAQGPRGRELVEYLSKCGEGLLGYALATTDINHDARRLNATGLEAEGPFSMQRQRPDGVVFRWRLLVPGAVAWRRPWPFFIQWDTPDDERLAMERPCIHPNRASGVVGVQVIVANLSEAVGLYERLLGIATEHGDMTGDGLSERATFQVGKLAIELVAPHGASPLQRALARQGSGMSEVSLSLGSAEERIRLRTAAEATDLPLVLER